MYHSPTGKDETLAGTQVRPRDGAFIKWWSYDEDVLEIIRMFVAYFGGDPDKGRPPATLSIVRKAVSILGIATRSGGDYQGRRRMAYMGRKWRERLETAGIDPDTLTVNNRKRWALTWDGLKKTGRYEPARVENAYRCKWFIPPEEELTPLEVAVTPNKSTLQRADEKAETKKKAEVDNYLSGVFKKNLDL